MVQNTGLHTCNPQFRGYDFRLLHLEGATLGSLAAGRHTVAAAHLNLVQAATVLGCLMMCAVGDGAVYIALVAIVFHTKIPPSIWVRN